jgi:hypothetical protein
MSEAALLTPFIILVLAVGTDLAYGALTNTAGAWRHGTMDTLTGYLACGGIPGTLVAICWGVSIAPFFVRCCTWRYRSTSRLCNTPAISPYRTAWGLSLMLPTTGVMLV